MKVGFIGLGRMGAGMAGRVQGAGYQLTVFDAIPSATAPFAAAAGPVVADGKRVLALAAGYCNRHGRRPLRKNAV